MPQGGPGAARNSPSPGPQVLLRAGGPRRMAATVPVLPHSDEAERAVLGSILLDSTLLEEIPLGVTDFYLQRHQVIFDACRELAADGAPVDIRTLQAALERRGEFEQVGGLAYLTGLDLDLPDIRRVGAYADIVRERAMRPRLLQAAERLDRRARTGQADAAAIAALASRELEGLQDPATEERGPSSSRLLRQLIEDTEARHERRVATGKAVLGLQTGVPRLDGLLSGLNRGLYLLAGPPGMGKTTFALQTALHVAREAPVVYASFENSATNLLLKALCGRAEISARDVRRGYVKAQRLAAAAAELEPALRRLDILDGDGRLTVAHL